jgi:hypothetical protein
MRFNRIVGAYSCILLIFASAVASAEIKVVAEHNDLDDSTAAFKFKTVPSPSNMNAARDAKFTIVDGQIDDASGGLDVLHDGKLSTEQDEPSANFFFNAGTEGGRIVMDLGRIIEVKRVDTYSWHVDTRAPQVYRLYGSDGTAIGFKSSPAKDSDPANVGWTLIASVDTRPKTGDVGGQYGVSIADSDRSFGKYRYLLIAATRTESDDGFGNTFFSEIDVIDAKEAASQPANTLDQTGLKQVEIDHGRYTATIDTTDAPDLSDWADKQLAPVVSEWYPQLVKMLPSTGYSAPTHFTIAFRENKKGVADTSGTRIECAAAWFRRELNGEAKGAIVHEMVHVVQQYGHARRTNPRPAPNPGWLVEGMADYIRWYKYEPGSNGAVIGKRNAERANYDDSYRVSANFLNWTVQKYDKDLINELNASMREGTYSHDIWEKLTGKSLHDLGDQWKTELLKSLGLTTQPTRDPT